MSAYNFVRSERNLTIFFVQRLKDPTRQRCLGSVAIFIDFREICGQTQKMSQKRTKF